MANSSELLAMPHSEALKEMVRQLVKPGVNVNHLDFGPSKILSDGNVGQSVFVDSRAYDDPTWNYAGETEIVYHRLDLDKVFGPLKMRFRFPEGVVKSIDILSRMYSILKIPMNPTDFILHTNTLNTLTGRVSLTAAPDSARWKGEIQIAVYR